MCLRVWSDCRYIGSLSKQHSKCLQHPWRVFILYRSLICSGSKPFRPEEQLLSVEGEIFLLTGFIGQNNISVYITVLMSIKSHMHPFIWKMKHFNGSIGTSRLMQSQTGQIFPKSFYSDLALVLLMNSQEHSPNFSKLALFGSIRHNLRN